MSFETNETELLEAIRKSLTDVGILGHFKAELRAAVMSLLSKNSNHIMPIEIPEETKLLNDLIREYLIWNGYVYAEQILVTESGKSSGKVRRDHLAAKLGVLDNNKTTKIPLLYYILSAFQNQE